jgi:hypothetical protein
MAFRLVNASFDAQAQRAYVELRDTDEDGEEIVATVTFSFRTFMPLPIRHIQKESCAKPDEFCSRQPKVCSGDRSWATW